VDKKEIIHHSFLRDKKYWGGRGHGDFFWKGGRERLSEVLRVRLSFRGGHTSAIDVNGNTIFIVRGREQMAKRQKWWAIFFVSWYWRYIQRLIFDSCANYDLGLLSSDGRPVQHKFTPATSILHPDTDGAPCQEHWHYWSVIGKLNFIAANTRPDISFAVHQCTKFSNQPQCIIHKKAVKHISRYVYLTWTQHQRLWLCRNVLTQ